MDSSPALDAARNFIDQAWGAAACDDAALAAALDVLLASYHRTTEARPSDSELEPPREDWRAVSAEIARRFPDYGFYPVADPRGAADAAPMVGDAVDDVLDITLAMREVLWRAEHLGVEDAIWYFRLDYFHWGRHARELALYLHARQFG